MRVKIHKMNKKALDMIEGDTYEEKVSNLIKTVELDMPMVDIDYSPITSINLSEDTLRLVESFKLTDGESYENVIVRLLVAQSLNK